MSHKITILFVEARYSDSARFSAEESMSLYVLSAFLEASLPEIDFDFTFTFSDQYQEYLSKKRYDICGIYSPTQAWKQACSVARTMKKSGSFVIVGGPHISSLPESLTKDFDMGCIGPGEMVLKKIVQLYKQYREIKTDHILSLNGIVFHTPEGLRINKPSYKDHSLNQNPSPYKYHLKPNVYRCRIISSTGCSHNCYFCAAKVTNPIFRQRSAENLVEEIVYLRDKYGIKNFKFIDDNFLVNRKRLKDLVRLLEDKGLLGKIAISCTSSAKLITEETVGLLKTLNTESVNFGFESGSERILKKLKVGKITLEDSKRAIELLNRHKIMVYGTFILGTPGETIEDINKTVQFVKKNRIHHLSCYLLKPLPGTPFWNDLVEEGRINPLSVDFQELALFNENPNWYFNNSVSLDDTLKYIKQINRIGTLRTIRYHFMHIFFYKFMFNQVKLKCSALFRR
jgi:radical SAM superfamily enzyme YgiQ (UPF0313 family)